MAQVPCIVVDSFSRQITGSWGELQSCEMHGFPPPSQQNCNIGHLLVLPEPKHPLYGIFTYIWVVLGDKCR